MQLARLQWILEIEDWNSLAIGTHDTTNYSSFFQTAFHNNKNIFATNNNRIYIKITRY